MELNITYKVNWQTNALGGGSYMRGYAVLEGDKAISGAANLGKVDELIAEGGEVIGYRYEDRLYKTIDEVKLVAFRRMSARLMQMLQGEISG